MSIKCEVWGKSPKGKDVHKFTMTNAMGASVSVIEWGAICTSIIVPDAGGNMDDVALGFDSLDRYIAPHGCFGDTVGRYGNRIGKGKFCIDGKEYQVALNDHGVNHLHGGNVGFSSHFWTGTPKEGKFEDSVSFHRISPDGEENYPGNLDVTVTYT
jgi:aldose 1-epimerase